MPKVSYSPQSAKQRPPGQGVSKNARKRAARKLGLKFSAVSAAMPAQRKVVRVRPKRAPGMAASSSDYTFSQFPSGRTSNTYRGGRRSRNAKGHLSEVMEFDEFVADVNGSVLFTPVGYNINPGLATTFPEGSVKAALYTEWKALEMEFYYTPEVSGNAAQGQGGKVILACDYNALNATPTTKQQVEIMDRADAMPYEEIRLRLDCRQINRADSKYLRTGPVGNGADLKTYDGGRLWVCTIGQANASLVGELRCRYRILCEKPTLLNAGSAVTAKSSSVYARAATQSLTTAVGVPIAFDTVAVDALSIGAGSSGTFTPPAGAYLLFCDVSVADTAAESLSVLMRIFKNGANTVPVFGSFAESTSASVEDVSCSCCGYILANGTDTFAVSVTATGAAGTLSIVAGRTQLIVMLA